MTWSQKTLQTTAAWPHPNFFNILPLISRNSAFWRKMKMGSDTFPNHFADRRVSSFTFDLPVLTGNSKMKFRNIILATKWPRGKNVIKNLLHFSPKNLAVCPPYSLAVTTKWRNIYSFIFTRKTLLKSRQKQTSGTVFVTFICGFNWVLGGKHETQDQNSESVKLTLASE